MPPNHEKGTRVRNPSHAGRSARHRSGALGLVRLTGVWGTGASMALLLAVLLLAPTAASASFTRKPVLPITSVAEPGGVAVNTENDLLIGDLAGPPFAVDEFGPSYEGNISSGSFAIPTCVEDKGKGNWEEGGCLTKAVVEGKGDFEESTSPRSVAVERGALSGNGDVYVGGGQNVEVYEGDGKLVEIWNGDAKPFNEPEGPGETRVAVDNSTSPLDPSACGSVPAGLSAGECFVYVATAGDVGQRLEKFNSKGEAVAFTAAGSYIAGAKKNEITGRPEGCGASFGGYAGRALDVTVDLEGDIYVAVAQCARVFEYKPSGEYMREFYLGAPGVPRIGPTEGLGILEGVAFDPVSRHLLVTVGIEGAGAVDEFEAETGRYVTQLTSAREGALEEPKAVAVDSDGDMYVAESTALINGIHHGRDAVDVWGPGAYYPTVTLAPTSARTSTTAVLHGSVNPGQHGNLTPAPVTACYFQYVEEAVYNEALAKKEEGGFPKANVRVGEAPCVEPDAAGIVPIEPEAAHPVKAEIKGLQPGVTYRYRLVASTDEADSGGTAFGEEVPAFTAPGGADDCLDLGR